MRINMVKATMVLTLLVVSVSNAQETRTSEFTIDNFDELVLLYEPIQREGVTDKKFKNGRFYLDQTKSATKMNPKNLNVAHYWNITMAFMCFGEPKEQIAIAFKKAVAANKKSVCAYSKVLGPERLGDLIPEVFLPFYEECGAFHDADDELVPKQYAEEHKLDLGLVTTIYEVDHRDQKGRSERHVDWSKQRPLDAKNQQIIERIYNERKTYVGKSLVGDRLSRTMWSVIQHSNLAMMEKYLPVIQHAVRDEELEVTPLKFLIDRIHTIKFDYQIFGSQVGVDLADEETRKKVAAAFGLE